MRYIANHLTAALPPSSFYGMTAQVYRLAGLNIGAGAQLSSSVRIWGEVDVDIGERSFIGHEVLIAGGRSKVAIGSKVAIAPRVSLITGSHRIDGGSSPVAGEGYSSDISIGNGAWIGSGATLLGGARVGERTIIGAHSLVSGPIPDDVIAVGSPCRVIKVWDAQQRAWRPC